MLEISQLMPGSFVSLIHIVGIGSTVSSPLWFPFPMGNLLLGITSGSQKSNIKALSRSFLLWRLGRLVPDFILPSVLCLSPLTLTSKLTLGRSSTALCPAQSAGDPKCSHLCKTFQVKFIHRFCIVKQEPPLCLLQVNVPIS